MFCSRDSLQIPNGVKFVELILDDFGMGGVFTDILVGKGSIVICRPRRVFIVHGGKIDEAIVCAVTAESIIDVFTKIHRIGLKGCT